MKYYALCNPDAAPENGTRIALFDLGDNELGQAIGMTVYTTPDGEAQRQDLKRYEGLIVEEVSSEELLGAYRIAMPSTVFLDGWRLAGSVLLGILKTELGLPIKVPTGHLLRGARMAPTGPSEARE